MTSATKQFKHDICPNCGSDAVHYIGEEWGDCLSKTLLTECEDCQHTWNQHFTLVFDSGSAL